MEEKIISEYLSKAYQGIPCGETAKTAAAIVNLLCEAGLTIAEAEFTLTVCKESLQLIRLPRKKEN